MKNYLSMGFGVNSVALYLLMQDLGMEFEAVFVNHGGDWPETYEYADYFIGTGRPVTVLKPKVRAKSGREFEDLVEYFEYLKGADGKRQQVVFTCTEAEARSYEQSLRIKQRGIAVNRFPSISEVVHSFNAPFKYTFEQELLDKSVVD